MYETVLYYETEKLGELLVYPQGETRNFGVKEMRITGFSQPSKRCPPLAVLHTITSSVLSFKMESKSSDSNYSGLYVLHNLCMRDKKTAIISFGGEELHLVAMHTWRNETQHTCFWAFSVAPGLYSSSLAMLNIRCLGIVFDLDETLIVANTMRSFEDKIEVLQRKLDTEVDPLHKTSMLAAMKRYHEDKDLLKQYAECDQIVDNGEVFKSQYEVVPALSDNHQPVVRPVIRLHEKNIILTRICPQIRYSSVLVRPRPAWEDLRRYLTARGRKRFEVYVCTKAERSYALEMWRLLDPEGNLIRTEELLDRIVCVKAGLKKSLLNVFRAGMCDPKMTVVVDDRLDVWDENDHPKVHVVPAYAPYHAPQAEANISPAVLCIVRNVACNARGSFFKSFDEGLLQRIPQILYEDNVNDILFPPDLSDYLLPEDEATDRDGTIDPSKFDDMSNVEVKRRLKDEATDRDGTIDPSKFDDMSNVEVKRRLKVAEISSSFPSVRPPNRIPLPEVSLQGSPDKEEGELPEYEVLFRDERPRSNLSFSHHQHQHCSGEGPSLIRPVSSSREPDFRGDMCTETPLEILEKITESCGCKVEFWPVFIDSIELQYCVEAWFAGRMMGQGTGRTRSEAIYQASKRSLQYLADIHEAYSIYGAAPSDNAAFNSLYSSETERQYLQRGISSVMSISPEVSRPMDPRTEGPWMAGGSIPALEELCMMQRRNVVFRPSTTTNSAEIDEAHAEVEVDGRVLGKGSGVTWDEAMIQAADRALVNLRTKREGSPRSMHDSKRVRSEMHPYPKEC